MIYSFLILRFTILPNHGDPRKIMIVIIVDIFRYFYYKKPRVERHKGYYIVKQSRPSSLTVLGLILGENFVETEIYPDQLIQNFNKQTISGAGSSPLVSDEVILNEKMEVKGLRGSVSINKDDYLHKQYLYRVYSKPMEEKYAISSCDPTLKLHSYKLRLVEA